MSCKGCGHSYLWQEQHQDTAGGNCILVILGPEPGQLRKVGDQRPLLNLVWARFHRALGWKWQNRWAWEVWLCLHPVASATDEELASPRNSALYGEISPKDDVAEGNLTLTEVRDVY